MGLNDGWELEGEPKAVEEGTLTEKIFEEVTPGEVPDLNEDNKVGVIVDQIKDLEYVRQDIVETGGMSQQMALEAERVMPGFLCGARPLGYFTKYPTATLYSFVLEELDVKIASMKQELAAAKQ